MPSLETIFVTTGDYRVELTYLAVHYVSSVKITKQTLSHGSNIELLSNLDLLCEQ